MALDQWKQLLEEIEKKKQAAESEYGAIAPQEQEAIKKQEDEDRMYKYAQGAGSFANAMGSVPTRGGLLFGIKADRPNMDLSEMAKPQESRKDVLSRYQALKDAAQKKAQGYGDSALDLRVKQLQGEEKFGQEKELLGYKNAAELKQAEAKAKIEKGSKGFEKESTLRKEITGLPVYKATSEVSNAYSRMLESQKNPSAASDMTLIYQYMKMVDPGSTVREGEFANAQNAAGVPEQIRNMFNKMQTGERLSEDQRVNFLNQAKSLYKGQMNQFNQAIEPYKGIVENEGLDYSRIAPGIGVYEKPSQEQLAQKENEEKEHNAALDWAMKNQKDPRAQKIIQMNQKLAR